MNRTTWTSRAGDASKDAGERWWRRAEEQRRIDGARFINIEVSRLTEPSLWT